MQLNQNFASEALGADKKIVLNSEKKSLVTPGFGSRQMVSAVFSVGVFSFSQLASQQSERSPGEKTTSVNPRGLCHTNTVSSA